MTSLLGLPVLLILAPLVSTAARGAEELCQIADWPCAALAATVGTKTVRAIHDPMHRDERILDGGIADITVRGGQLLNLVWKAKPETQNKAKPKVKISVISNKQAPAGCAEPRWPEETLGGSKVIEFPACHLGRNFVLTYKMEQGKGKEAVIKTARIRVHVVPKQARLDESADQDAPSTESVAPKLPPGEEADFKQLGDE